MNRISHDIVLFDGLCNLCNHSVQFIIKKDRGGIFQFASIQSEIGQKLLNTSGQNVPNSIVYISDGRIFTESDAVLRICKKLGGQWRLFYGLIIIPKPLRDLFYKWIANNRYKWFGKRDQCALPTSKTKSRFIG